MTRITATFQNWHEITMLIGEAVRALDNAEFDVLMRMQTTPHLSAEWHALNALSSRLDNARMSVGGLPAACAPQLEHMKGDLYLEHLPAIVNDCRALESFSQSGGM